MSENPPAVHPLRARAVRLVRRSLPQAYTILLWKEYLTSVGWARTVSSRVPEDRDGNPLPWLTYAAIDLLSQRLRADFRVFEYGSGQSTLWWAQRVAEVVAVEHDAAWAARVRSRAPANVTVRHHERGSDAYLRAPVDAGGGFNVIVVDGRDRVACASHAIASLAADGVAVWDNSDVEKYRPGLALFADAGFKQLDLVGLGPVNPSGWSTSVLYRSENCLDL